MLDSSSPGTGRLPSIFSKALIYIVIWASSSLALSQIEGVVIHSETGQPLSKVSVVLLPSDSSESGCQVMTDNQGHFLLNEVLPGIYQLTVSAVGFGLIKRELQFLPEEPLQLEIYLSPGTAVVDEVTVAAEVGEVPARLSASEINNLKSVLTDDAIRALQHLPSLAANDDFNTGFAIQGSGFDRVGILFDGIPAHSFRHTIQGAKDTGSTTLLSADVIEDLDLFTAGNSARWSGHSAGFINMKSRSGNRARWRNLFSISGSAFMFLSEGPLGNGSWLASARKSYVDWIIRRIEPDTELNFGYWDLFGKATQFINENHQLSISYLHGNTGLSDVAEGSGMNSLDRGRFVSNLMHLEWDWFVDQRLTGRSHLYYQRAHSWNQNPHGAELWRNEEDVFGIRSVWDLQFYKNWTLSSGVTAEHWSALNRQNFFQYGINDWLATSFFDVTTSRQELFLEVNVPLSRKVTLLGGWSWNRQARMAKPYHSPFAGFELVPADGHRLSLRLGRSGQFPFFNQLYGIAGNVQLLPEVANGAEARWSFRDSQGYELSASTYYRWRKRVPWRYQGLWRLKDGEIVPPSPDPYMNILADRSYGGEVVLGRRVTNGLSGWIAYAWNKSLWSEERDAWFAGNYDQRNGISLFVHYRWTSNVEVSSKWRFASGMPLPVYAQKKGEQYFVAEQRNQERLPDYRRLDVRLAKSFPKDRYRVTLFLEILNLLNRDNLRYAGYEFDSVNPDTGRIKNLTSQQFPILPTAGIVFEF